jgi:hypothetical protein
MQLQKEEDFRVIASGGALFLIGKKSTQKKPTQGRC